MLVIPAIDLEGGRSRLVYWPGAAAGTGAPTDRPDRIAERFVALGARVIHLVDFDGARAGAPGNLEAVGAVAGRAEGEAEHGVLVLRPARADAELQPSAGELVDRHGRLREYSGVPVGVAGA